MQGLGPPSDNENCIWGVYKGASEPHVGTHVHPNYFVSRVLGPKGLLGLAPDPEP